MYRLHVEIISYLDDMVHESPALLMLARKAIGRVVRTIVSEFLATVTRAVRRTQFNNLKASRPKFVPSNTQITYCNGHRREQRTLQTKLGPLLAGERWMRGTDGGG
jgi:hypothetical protein